MNKYVKKPIPVEAIRWTGDNYDEIKDFIQDSGDIIGSGDLIIYTLEGDMTAPIGSYVIKGIHGEFYPCDGKIFEESYKEYEEEIFHEMSIDDAIRHCEDVSKDCSTGNGCASQHIQLANWLKELKDLRSKYQYLSADVQNIKRRFDRERHDIITSANKDIIVDLVNVYDDIDRAIDATHDKNTKDGFIMVKKQFEHILENEGCEKIECHIGDEFDANTHEALYTEESNVESGRISKIISSGWILCGKLIRPVKVVVSK